VPTPRSSKHSNSKANQLRVDEEKVKKKSQIYKGMLISSVRREIERVIDGVRIAVCEIDVKTDEDLNPAERVEVWRFCMDFSSKLEKALLSVLEQLRSG